MKLLQGAERLAPGSVLLGVTTASLFTHGMGLAGQMLPLVQAHMAQAVRFHRSSEQVFLLRVSLRELCLKAGSAVLSSP